MTSDLEAWFRARPPPLASLPPALLERARDRLAGVALGATVMLFGAQVITFLWWSALGREGVFRYRPGGDLVSACLCLLLFFLVRSRGIGAAVALRIGLVFQVALCASIFFFETVNGERGAGWGTFVIAVFPLLVPAPPRLTTITSVLSALSAPLAVGLAAALANALGADRLEHPWAVLLSLIPPQAFALFIALAGSRALRAGSVDILELEQERRLVETILSHSGTAVVLVDEDDVIAYANDEAARLFSVRRADLRQKPRAELFAGPNEPLRAIWEGSADETLSIPLGGELETFHVRRQPITIAHRAYTLWMARRLTAVLRSREVSAYKRLLRAFAHEINNSLGALRSMVRSARTASESPDQIHLLRPSFERMEACVVDLGAFFERYLPFVRLPSPRVEAVVWSDFLSALDAMVTVRRVGALPSRAGRFDPAQLRQVLLNLVKNAHESGSAADDVTLEVRDEGSEVVLEVADRGAGLSLEAKELALTPFFSTKPEGTGLGLAISLEIIESHGGRMQIVGRDGGGTLVRCSFPA